ARGGEVEATAWGPGAEWALEHTPQLLGEEDRPEEFEPRHPFLSALQARFTGMRIGRSEAVVEALVASVIEQKVPSVQAHLSQFRLVMSWGERAPAPNGIRPGPALMLPPDPRVLAELPYYAFHPLGIERRRADTIRRCCAWAQKLEAASSIPIAEAHRRLMMIPGVGPWTAAEVAAVALGDPDAVSVGDYHLPHQVSWALEAEARGTDARMLELLEPYRGQRGRVIRLITASGLRPPRFGHRMPLRSIAHI
ncbi:MAG: DNA-3-methyladenine glycosylase 2 family protein, partial [Actinomycetota bacterium]|nr:DNA-3-methyladenine glycosylase 2 family protein [Actinomycetota bacterium]